MKFHFLKFIIEREVKVSWKKDYVKGALIYAGGTTVWKVLAVSWSGGTTLVAFSLSPTTTIALSL